MPPKATGGAGGHVSRLPKFAGRQTNRRFFVQPGPGRQIRSNPSTGRHSEVTRIGEAHLNAGMRAKPARHPFVRIASVIYPFAISRPGLNARPAFFDKPWVSAATAVVSYDASKPNKRRAFSRRAKKKTDGSRSVKGPGDASTVSRPGGGMATRGEVARETRSPYPRGGRPRTRARVPHDVQFGACLREILNAYHAIGSARRFSPVLPGARRDCLFGARVRQRCRLPVCSSDR